jgi:cytochrome c2
MFSFFNILPVPKTNKMKKVMRFLLFALGFVVLLVAVFASFIAVRGVPKYKAAKTELKVEITPENVERGRQLSTMLCNDCHMDPNTGKLTGRQMDEISQFGAIYSKNITKDPKYGIGKWSDGEIAYLLRTGVTPTGKFLPVMAKLSKMSDQDLNAIIAFLRSDHAWVQPDNMKLPESSYSFFAKFLTNIKAVKPMPFPDHAVPPPDTTNQVKWGEYVALNRVECYSCHSQDFAKNDYTNPAKSAGYFGGGNEFKMPDGSKMRSMNLTMDEETGIGTWTEEDFVKAVKTGVVPNGPALRQPMKPYADLTDGEVKAVFAYLKTIPKIKNKVDRGL